MIYNVNINKINYYKINLGFIFMDTFDVEILKGLKDMFLVIILQSS